MRGMGDKALCPGCGGYLSSILAAFKEGRPCPQCGLSADAAAAVVAVQAQRGDAKLKAQLVDEIKLRHAAEEKAARLERQVARMRRVLEEP